METRAKNWHDDNQNKKGSIRDYVSTLEIAILSNIEFQNAKLIEQELFNKNKEKAYIN